MLSQNSIEKNRIDKSSIEKESVSKDTPKKKPKTEKIHFAEFVTMTNAEYEKLVSTYGKEFVDQCISVLDNYKGSSGRKYASDYRAILSWVVDKVSKQITKQQRTTGNPFFDLLKEEQDEARRNDSDYGYDEGSILTLLPSTDKGGG